MSKINYLIIILLLAGICLLFTSQFRLATQSATQLVSIEVAKKIEIHIVKTFESLKRYPNSAHEFETLVLKQLNFSNYPQHIMLTNFTPGDASRPAFFHISIKEKSTTGVFLIPMEYYGSDFQSNPFYKGKILRRPPL